MLGGYGEATNLIDRVGERRALGQLLAGVRSGESHVLVLRGEAGVGKTALLRHLPTAAVACRVTWATGVESEMELAFAGLHALCAPLLDGIDSLPSPQRDALGTAFGLSDGSPPERFLVGLAVLSLFANVAEKQPLLCIVDDAQWLDQVSAQTLAFVARRLLAERVGFVFAVRDSSGEHAFEGFPELVVDGLAPDDARLLLDATLVGPLDEHVKSRILDETRGNPLALMELPRGLTPAQLAGGFGFPDASPLTGRIERSFLQRIDTLPRDTQRLLLTAATEPLGDVSLLWRAAERLGIGTDAGRPAEADGLIELGPRVRFAHPLIRSAVSPMPRRRPYSSRLRSSDRLTNCSAAGWNVYRAEIVFTNRRGRDAPQLLLDAARQLDPLDGAARAHDISRGDRCPRCSRGGSPPGPTSAKSPRPPGPRITPEPGASPTCCLTVSSRDSPRGTPRRSRHFRVRYARSGAWTTTKKTPFGWGSHAGSHRISGTTTSGTPSQRVASASPVPTARWASSANALNYVAAFNVHAGVFVGAAAAVEEVEAITLATGLPPLRFGAYKLVVSRGDQERMPTLSGPLLENTEERGEGSAFGGFWTLTALLHNSYGQYGKALTAAWHACEHVDVMVYGWALVELIEAGVRAGVQDEAADALDRLRERTHASGTEWALGTEARARALVHGDEPAYQESIERLALQPWSHRARRGAGSSTASGSGARTVASTCASSCGPRTSSSARWVPTPSPSGLAASCSRQARQRVGGPPSPATP